MTRIVCMSDTHGHHGELVVPDGDVLIHAGDFTQRGTLEQPGSFTDWYAALPHKYKIVVSGNHDLCLPRAGDTSGTGVCAEKTRQTLCKRGHELAWHGQNPRHRYCPTCRNEQRRDKVRSNASGVGSCR